LTKRRHRGAAVGAKLRVVHPARIHAGATDAALRGATMVIAGTAVVVVGRQEGAGAATIGRRGRTGGGA
jgi:hypothetical protein